MKERMSIKTVEPRVYKGMAGLDEQIAKCEIDPTLRELIKIRVSQINGCGYCVNSHSKDAIEIGETQQRIFALSAWWETPFFTETEMAALKLATEVTLISQHGVSEETFENARRLLGEKGLSQVILVAIAMNAWNRIAISTRMVAEL
jgi:AhpD family alkylhydroperoxidase